VGGTSDARHHLVDRLGDRAGRSGKGGSAPTTASP
jgi:hypothetical protein